MSSQPKPFLTPEEYLEIERKAELKSEYWRGEMFAMSGVSEAHNLITGNLIASLHGQMRGRNCRVYSGDIRLRVADTGLYTYPDLIGLCGERQFADSHVDMLLNPSFIVEVLSPSTEAYDRGRKFERYRALASLREYVLIAQDRVHVELFTRQPDGLWLLRTLNRRSETIELASVDCQIALDEVYENVGVNEAA